MSRMLTLVQDGWAVARGLARSGRAADALAHARRLLARPDLPGTVAADAHRLAAEMLLDRERYAAARRHLRAAAKLEPGYARTYYLAGRAFEQDPLGDDRKAAVRYKKAVELESGNALYRAAFGRAAVRCDRVNRGVKELAAAVAAAPADLTVVRVVVSGLTEAGHVSAARRVVRLARFARPRCAVVRGLWNRVRFEAARVGQRNTSQKQDATLATDGDPYTLPFLRPVGTEPAREPADAGDTVRRDVLSFRRPHFDRLRVGRADR